MGVSKRVETPQRHALKVPPPTLPGTNRWNLTHPSYDIDAWGEVTIG